VSRSHHESSVDLPMSFLTSHTSLLPPLTHLPTTWTPSSRPVLRFARLLHPTPLLLQVLRNPCHARPRRPRPRHARPRLHASPSPPLVYQRRHPTPVLESSRVGSSVYHPVAMAHDPRSTHPMIIRRAAGVTKPVDRLQLSAVVAPPTLSPVPTSVRSALANPH
jgi:hypothetical protein